MMTNSGSHNPIFDKAGFYRLLNASGSPDPVNGPKMVLVAMWHDISPTKPIPE